MVDFKYQKMSFKAVNQGDDWRCDGCCFYMKGCIGLRGSKQIPECYEIKDGVRTNVIYKPKGDGNADKI